MPLYVVLDPTDERPLYRQIVAQVKEQAASGALQPGEDLPSVRDMASALGVNLHTVHRAYKDLREMGVVSFTLGRRARVNRLARVASEAEVERELGQRLREVVTDAKHLGLDLDALERRIRDAWTKEP